MHTESALEEFDRTVIGPGFRLLELVAASQTWVHRRVEAVRLSQDDENRVNVSLDLTLPDAVRELAYPNPVVPLAVMRKNELRKLDVVGDDGRPLCVLTREENGRLVESMLLALLAMIFPISVVASPRCRAALHGVITSPPSEAHIAVARFRGWASVQPGRRERSEDYEVLLYVFLEIFSRNFFLCAEVDESYIGSRRILKYSHEDVNTLEGGAGIPMVLSRQLGTTSMAGSYHIEIEVPPELGMRSLAVYERNDDQEWQELAYRENSYAESVMHASFQHDLVLGEHSAGTEVRVLLVPVVSGTLLAAVWASIFTLLLIVAGCVLRWRAADLLRPGQETDQVAAVLLTVPAVMMTWIGTAPEHRLVATLKAPFRRVLVASAGVLFIAAMLTAIPFTKGVETSIWGTLASFQALVVARTLWLRHLVLRTV